MTLSVVPIVAAPQIELRNIDALIPYARNSRTHSSDQVAQIAASMDEFGVTNMILIDDNGIVAGHGRVMGARALYKAGKTLRFANGAPIPEGMVPVINCNGWTPAQRQAYIIADNKIALNAGWDEELLALELRELAEGNYDLSLLGFSGDELDELLADGAPPPPDTDPDDAPDLPAAPHSVPGDVWVLGPHRVMCGSSTEVDSWDKLMAGEKADIVVTDPPYNVAYEGKTKDKLKIENDSMGASDFRQFLLDFYTAIIGIMKPGAPIYVYHADTEGLNFRSAFAEAGFKLSGCLIWRKNVMVLGRSDYQWQHEPCLYGWKPGAAHRWYGGRKLTTVLEHGEGGPISRLADGRWAVKVGDDTLIVDASAQLEQHPGSVIFHEKPARNSEHPTMKPVGLIEKNLRASSRSGDIVVDGFGGSGTTLIAADRMGQSARLMELDPRYVDVIVKRWEKYTGRKAVHAETGLEFPTDEAPESAS